MYLLGQIWWLLLIAYLLGILFGYLIWRACGLPRFQSLTTRNKRHLDDRIALLERDNARLETLASEATAQARQLETERVALLAKAAAKLPAPTQVITAPPVPTPVIAGPPGPMIPRDAVTEVIFRQPPSSPRPTVEAPKFHNDRVASLPVNGLDGAQGLEAPINGRSDNLRLIRGIGPRLEKILNSMGIYHFEQIAGWTEKDLAEIDARLGSFAGRAVRDNWIDQSRRLAGLVAPGDSV